MKPYSLILILLLILSASFSSCTKTEKSYQIIKLSGDHQTGSRGGVLAEPIRLRLVDENNVGVADVRLQFSAYGGGYTNVETVYTNSRGEMGVDVYWTLGITGNQQLNVFANNINGVFVRTVTFEATAVGAFNLVKSSFIDNRDGESYETIEFGTQVWMAENLRFNMVGSFENLSNPDSSYGRLYDWAATETACPSGWHLPTDEEWLVFEGYIGLTSTNSTGIRGTVAGRNLKSATGWPNNSNGNDLYGFTVLPAGSYAFGSYASLGTSAFYWTDTPDSTTEAWSRTFYSNYSGIGRYTKSTGYAFSCRCVQD